MIVIIERIEIEQMNAAVAWHMRKPFQELDAVLAIDLGAPAHMLLAGIGVLLREIDRIDGAGIPELDVFVEQQRAATVAGPGIILCGRPASATSLHDRHNPVELVQMLEHLGEGIPASAELFPRASIEPSPEFIVSWHRQCSLLKIDRSDTAGAFRQLPNCL